ncbi:MAG: YdcH family protein [Gammaproteobacteria bacterium]|nr:YdcH family protein [Gammaproteobacteria bacterium]
MDDTERDILRQRLESLKVEHRDLDDIITRLSHDPMVDQLQLIRLKKRKLVLKDMIAKISSQLIPDLEA